MKATLPCVSECEHGGSEADVFGSGAVFSPEGDESLERSRQVPAEPRLRPDSAQLLLGLLLLRTALHRGIAVTRGISPGLISGLS